ncbi:MAG: hypothetical protein Q8M33_08325 [Hydrogenophaga sp.]|nr:hypothetical protein [Hydrogenophaga sp.]
MKSRKLTLSLTLGTALGISMLTVACGSGNSPDLETATPAEAPLQAVGTPIQVQVFGSTEEPIVDTDFTITITGSNKDKVVDALGKPVTSITTAGGAALLTLASGTTLPATFNVMVSAPGYLPTGKTVFVSEAGVVDVSVPVVKLVTATPVVQADGSTVAALTEQASGIAGNVIVTPASAVNSAGVVTAAAGFAFTSPATTATIDSQVTLTIPSGVKMTDASGQPITGTVTANVVSYSPTEDAALAAFPGGFAVDVASDTSASATTSSGTFISGGFAAFNLVDSTGKTVKSFDKPVTTSITVPAATTNPDGSAITVGQDMPIWSYDETIGRWIEEKVGKVARTDTLGNYVVEFEVTHLSYWNMDWLRSANCRANVRVNMPTGATRVNLSAKFVGLRGYLYSGYADSNASFPIYRAPANLPVDITMSVPGAAGTVTTRIQNLCANGGAIQLDARSLQVPTPGSVSGTVYEACFTTGGVEIASTRRPLVATVRFWGYSAANQYVYRHITTLANGTYSLAGLPAGTRYTSYSFSPRRFSVASARFSSNKINQSVISGANNPISDFVFPMRCNNVTGAAS